MFHPVPCRWPSVFRRALAIGLLGLCTQSPVIAEEAKQTTLTLREALSRSLEKHPTLARYPFRARAAEARALQAGLSPNPELSLEVENLGGSGRFEGVDSAESSLVLSQVIELGGKRDSRRSVAQLRGELIDHDYALARLDVLTQTAEHYLAVARAQERLRLAELARTLAERARATAKSRVEAGRANAAELNRARIALTRAELDAARADRTLATARRRLAANWGQTGTDFSRVDARLFELPEVPDFETLSARLDASPQLTRLLTRERLKQAEMQLARSRGRQNLTIGGGIKRFEETGDNALVFSVSMPLGLRDRNQGEVVARRAEYEQVAAEQQATRLALSVGLHRAYQQLEQARDTARSLKHEALPQAEQALERTEDGYASGRYSYLELMDTRRERLAVEREAIEAAVGFFEAVLALERLTGEPLTAPTAQAAAESNNR